MHKGIRLIIGISLLTILGFSQAMAATFSVTPTSDGNCSDNDCDLQSALDTAANNDEGDIIQIAAGTYDASAATFTYVADTTPSSEENFPLTVSGAGAGQTILDGPAPAVGQVFIVDTTGLTDDSGAAITFENLTFQEGRTAGGTPSGGGLRVRTEDADVTVSDCEFVGNVAFYGGGGASVWSSGTGDIIYRGNSFINNEADNIGGGGAEASAEGTGSVSFIDNQFSENTSLNVGGGAYVHMESDSSVFFVNNTFFMNTCDGVNFGGGAHVFSSKDSVITFTNNSAYNNDCRLGGGFGFSAETEGSVINLYNNIVYGNTAVEEGDDIYIENNDSDVTGAGGIVNLFNNDFSDFVEDCNSGACIMTVNQGDNIDQDPLFVDSVVGDLHLQAGSPAINQGDPSAPELPNDDIDGDPRYIGAAPDMGVDEYTACGDGSIDAVPGEECDDGNTDAGDGCDETCVVEYGFECTGEPSVCSACGDRCHLGDPVREVGENDFQISEVGPDSDPDHDASSPAVAYNSTENEYLVVWAGDYGVDNAFEIYGQIVDAETGEVEVDDFRISDMGSVDSDDNFRAYFPSVAYNPTTNEYLVVWEGDDDTGDLVNNAAEIFGQRISATGTEEGDNDFRISYMGSDDSDPAYGASYPDVSYNSTDDQFLVVWQGEDDVIGPDIYLDDEIYAQRLAGDGSPVGENFRISQMGTWDEVVFDFNLEAFSPRVAYNSSDNEYLVVWQIEARPAGDPPDPWETWDKIVYGRRIPADGVAVEDNFPISHSAFSDGPTVFTAWLPDVSYNATDNEYLVVWVGTDSMGILGEGELEIFGRLVSGDGSTSQDVFRISDMGGDGDNTFEVWETRVAYNPLYNEYMVAWSGEDDTGGQVYGESEIFVQRIDADGAEVGGDVRISDMGQNGRTEFDAWEPAITFNATNNEYFVVWEGDDFVNGETEIFAQSIAGPSCNDGFLDPIEVCEDGNTGDGDGCSADCLSDETCGNWIVDTVVDEECDDGNTANGDGCNDSCRNEGGGGCRLIRNVASDGKVYYLSVLLMYLAVLIIVRGRLNR